MTPFNLSPMSIQIVRQPPMTQCCGAACLAMLAHLTLDSAISLVGAAKVGSRQLISAARKFGYVADFKCVKGLDLNSNPPDTALVLLRGKDKKNGHWVLWSKGQWFDPERGITSILGNLVPERHWPLRRVKFKALNPSGAIA